MTNTKEKRIRDLVKNLAKIAYPDYGGRKFSVSVQNHYYLSDFWDGGSRNYCVAIDIKTGRIAEPSVDATIPFHSLAHTCVEIPQGIGILERCFFCGKDVGVTLYISSPLAIEAVNTKQIEA